MLINHKSMKSKVNFLLLFLQFIFLFSLFSQNLVWTGNANDGLFFNEVNWKNTATYMAPAAGTIDQGVTINANQVVFIFYLQMAFNPKKY